VKLRDRFLCLLGRHGPGTFGNALSDRSHRTVPFERKCLVCGTKWRTDPKNPVVWTRVKK
jgi:hypothetical protein